MRRHFTVTGFVSTGGKTALHWHRLGFWLPPGGHIEPDEDPAVAMLREVREETGFEAAILGVSPPFRYSDPPQLARPETIAVYDIARDSALDERHQHIDFIYFTKPLGDGPFTLPAELGWRWVSARELLAADPIGPPGGGAPAPVKPDVRELGLAAIAALARTANLGLA